jgi:hypothetical protein
LAAAPAETTEDKKCAHGTNATELEVMIRMLLTGQGSAKCQLWVVPQRGGVMALWEAEIGHFAVPGVTLLPHLVPTQP